MAAQPNNVGVEAAPAVGWIGAFEAFKVGFRALPKYPQFVALYIVVNIISTFITKHNPKSLFGELVAIAITLLLIVAFTKYNLAVADSRVESLPRLLATSAQEYFRVLGALVLVFGLTVLSFIGLLIPLIWVIPWTAFVLYVIIESHVGPLQALRASKQVGGKHKSEVWGIIGVSFLYILLAGILTNVPVIGWLLSAVASSAVGLAVGAATAQLYRYAQPAQPAA